MFGAVMTCQLQPCATAHSLAPGCCSICCPRPSPKIFLRIQQDLAGLQKFLSDIESDLLGLTAILIGLNLDLTDIPTTIDEVLGILCHGRFFGLRSTYTCNSTFLFIQKWVTPPFVAHLMEKVPSGKLKSIENGHLQYIFPTKMVMFHSYVKLPWKKQVLSHGMDQINSNNTTLTVPKWKRTQR